jgi:hypothetical protein
MAYCPSLFVNDSRERLFLLFVIVTFAPTTIFPWGRIEARGYIHLQLNGDTARHKPDNAIVLLRGNIDLWRDHRAAKVPCVHSLPERYIGGIRHSCCGDVNRSCVSKRRLQHNGSAFALDQLPFSVVEVFRRPLLRRWLERCRFAWSRRLG